MFCCRVMKRHSSLLWSLLSWWWWWWWVWKWPETRNLNQDPLRWSFDKPFCNNKSSLTAFLMSIFNTSSESISPQFVVYPCPKNCLLQAVYRLCILTELSSVFPVLMEHYWLPWRPAFWFSLVLWRSGSWPLGSGVKDVMFNCKEWHVCVNAVIPPKPLKVIDTLLYLRKQMEFWSPWFWNIKKKCVNDRHHLVSWDHITLLLYYIHVWNVATKPFPGMFPKRIVEGSIESRRSKHR